MNAKLNQLRRLRWLVLTVVVLGIAVSVTMNVMHAPDNTMARVVGGFPPVAVFVCIELISRIPATSLMLSVGRIIGSLVVAGVGGSVSYVQQMDYVHQLGYDGWIATVFPACIDGVMMVATLSLVEVVRKIRALADVEDVAPVTTVAKLRAVADQYEDPNTLAYRQAAAQLRSSSQVPSLNGKSALAQAS